MIDDEKWMKIAFNEALKARDIGEIPVGSILIKDNQMIAKSHNRPIHKNDATAHAEIEVIRASGEILKNYRLVGTTMYVTLQPCNMCLAAIAHARIDKVVFGAYNTKPNGDIIYENLINLEHTKYKIKITGGIYESECSKLLRDFFKTRR
jgi:tRNA(adenine34) deaminase